MTTPTPCPRCGGPNYSPGAVCYPCDAADYAERTADLPPVAPVGLTSWPEECRRKVMGED